VNLNIRLAIFRKFPIYHKLVYERFWLNRGNFSTKFLYDSFTNFWFLYGYSLLNSLFCQLLIILQRSNMLLSALIIYLITIYDIRALYYKYYLIKWVILVKTRKICPKFIIWQICNIFDFYGLICIKQLLLLLNKYSIVY
jgi:hypothetical protein